MGIDLNVTTAYGFFLAEETSEDLVERLGRADDYEVDSWPDRKLLAELGYPGLLILERHTMGDEGGWAICTEESLRSIDPKYEDGIWLLEPAEPSPERRASLTAVRELLFPDLPNGWGEAETPPEIGWLLISSIY